MASTGAAHEAPIDKITALILPDDPSSIRNTGSRQSARNPPAIFRDRGGSTRRRSEPAEAYELVTYVGPHARNDDEVEPPEQVAKRAAKRQWLDDQDEMKFSHSIQFNAVPDWSSHYIAYSNLKKL